MIKNKQDLKLYLQEDLKAIGYRHRYMKPQYPWTLWLLYKNAYLWHFLKHLRYEEYNANVKTGKTCKMKIFYHSFLRRWYGLFLPDIEIPRNTLGYGTKFMHYGKIVIAARARLGNYCWLYPGICVGAGPTDEVPVIDDHVFIGMNAGIYGGVKIGKDAFIAPNAVVTHDVETGTIVAGVPAKTLKGQSPQLFR